MTRWRNYLKRIYYDPAHPGAFAGSGKLYRVVKDEGQYPITQKQIQQWLNDQDAYSLQKQVKYKFKRNRVVSKGLDHLWDMDLADVSSLKKQNKDMKFLLIVIDVFSRYLWVVPLINKQHKSVIKGLKKVFAEGRKPLTLRSDFGKEFHNHWMKAFLKKHGIDHFGTLNETKANYAERVIRTLKGLMFRYFTQKQTLKYLDILSDLVHNYNNRPHRSINNRHPADINERNQSLVWKQQYIDTIDLNKVKKIKPYTFSIGDLVRIPHLKKPFQRDYQQKWTEELFYIVSRRYRQSLPIYQISDYANDPIKGTFYENELQKVNKNRHDLWRVDKVHRKRRYQGREQWFVSFVGWPIKFNAWVLKSDIVHFKLAQ